MPAYMVGQLVVLRFLEGGIVESILLLVKLLCERLQQEVYEGRVVEDTVNVGAHALGVDDIAVLATVGEMEQR
jgi:hypothetical protein